MGITGHRGRSARALLVLALLLSGIVTVLPATPASAIGVPVWIDDFVATRFGTRTVTLLPLPTTSTTPVGTWSESGGVFHTQTRGDGNTAGGTLIDYDSPTPVDLTSAGNNTQLFLEFESIDRHPVTVVGETALSITAQITSQAVNGVLTTGTYNTGIANVNAFNVVLNFSCVDGPPCFSPQPDFTRVTHVQVQLRHPKNQDFTSRTDVRLAGIRTTPTGGVVPAPPSPSVATVDPYVVGATEPALFDVTFRSSGVEAAVTHTPMTNDGLLASSVTTFGTAPGTKVVTVTGGPTTYRVQVTGMTDRGTVGIHVPAGVVQDAWASLNLASTADPTVLWSDRAAPPMDVDADGDTDIGVFRPSGGRWYVSPSATPATFGTSGDVPLPADYDGDGDADRAVWRASGARWFVDGLNQGIPVNFGRVDDRFVPADYDGDDDAELATWRPSTGEWVVQGAATIAFGINGDIPVPADYDGDGDVDRAVFRPSDGRWYVAGVAGSTVFGINGDIPVPGDYDGDGDADLAVFRPSVGKWYVLGGATTAWGTSGDVPVPGDYDGDGDSDLVVFRPSTNRWYVSGGATTPWGASGDTPLSRPLGT